MSVTNNVVSLSWLSVIIVNRDIVMESMKELDEEIRCQCKEEENIKEACIYKQGFSFTNSCNYYL